MATPALVRPHPGGSGASIQNYIDRTALTNIKRGHLCILTADNLATQAQPTGSKAVGIATQDTIAGEIVRIQVFGIFDTYPFSAEMVGATYYQGDNGSATPIASTTNIPAFIAIGDGKVNILDDTGSTGGSAPTIDGFTIRAIAEVNIRQGELCEMLSNGHVIKATEFGRKAVGMCYRDMRAYELGTVQVSGVFHNYEIFPTLPNVGTVYYQADDGQLQATPTKYPAAIALDTSSLLILNDTGITSAFEYIQED